MEMIRFCATIHPTWGRVMQRHREARAVAFADDGYIDGELRECLLILAELKQAFKDDCGLDLQLSKCKLYIKGMTLHDARTLVGNIIRQDQRLSDLADMLHQHADQSKNVIQVDGITCVGVPIGSTEFITAFVKAKTSDMVDDVKKLRVLSDPLTHARLIKFCHNTRLSYLNRNLPPDVMRNPTCGLQTVDQAISLEVMRRGTDLGLPDAPAKNMCDGWTEDERNWHARTMQLAHHMSGLGLTPQCASGIAAFYHSTARFVGWLAQLDAPTVWIGLDQDLDDHATWTASNLIALASTHRLLLQDFNCVESAPDHPADPAAGDDANDRDSDGLRPAAPLSLPPLDKLASQHASEDESTALPDQRRVTVQIMRNWEQHLTIQDNPPSSRCAELDRMHRSQAIDAISRTQEGDSGHSILQQDMPDDEEYDCEPNKRRKLRYSPSAWLSCFHLYGSWPVAQRKSAWTSWFCQYLGLQIPQLMLLARRQEADRPSQHGDQPPPPLVCPCNKHVIDTYCDHIHTCRQHTGSRKDAHETILDALERICHDSGLTTQRRYIPSIRKKNGKNGRGDLLIKDANVGGNRHLIIDIACTHEFCGNTCKDVTRNGQLRDRDVNKILETTARTKVERYRDAYANRSGTTYAFLPCVMSTSGRIHGEFLRLLYILAHRRTNKYFADMGDHEPGTDAFTWRRSQYFWKHKAAIGLSTAVAVARRAHLAHPPRPRQWPRASRPTAPTYADILSPTPFH